MSTAAEETFVEITGPGGRTRETVGAEPLTIGRHADNKVVLVDDQASRHHAVIERTPTGVYVKDLDSRNGTKVNGQNVHQSLLIHGDIVTVGATNFRLSIPSDLRNKFTPKEPEPLDELEEIADEVVSTVEGDYEGRLRHMAESLADKSFDVDQITLINARGGVANAPRPKNAPKQQGSEVVDAFRLLVLICVRIKATDVHVEPKSEEVVVRIRVDGTMVDVVRLNKDIGTRLMALVKVLSDIDIAQRNIVQEGHFSARVPGRQINYRVSFTPATFGQKLVLRILDTANAPMHLWDLNLPEWMAKDLEVAMKAEAGMVLVCGPTGSGKTTTLYGALRSIDTNQRNVVTIEDPVEIHLDGVTQMPVDEDRGNTFLNLLRSVLRQDPDAIMIGEIRDPETARVAMQAAITGHLVFSTVHAKDTFSTVFRLLDLGVEPYLVSQGLGMVLAQRLVRNLCRFCKKAVRPAPDQLKKLDPALQKQVREVYVARGCPRCLGTGYLGRRAVFELLAMSATLREIVQRGPTVSDLRIAASEGKFATLQQSAYRLVAEGVTSFDEVDRAVGGN